MSLDALVAEVGQALSGARRLFGEAPVSGVWGSTGTLGGSRDAVSRASGAAGRNWQGAAGSRYVSASGGRVAALDSVVGADGGTGPGLTGSADGSRTGRWGMDSVISDTHRGVAALAPSTDTPAGRQQLVNHLQSQLDRAKALLRVSEQRNVLLATMIRNASAGYRAGMGAAGTMPAMGAGAPPIIGGGAPGLTIPNLAGLTKLGGGPGANNGQGLPRNAARVGSGGSPSAQMAVKAALSKLGRPYVWGAKGPDAFDCSGLIKWSYAQAGVTLGPDTYTQITQGELVAPGDVDTGDMVFPKESWDGEGPSHVMLAISPTEVVEAQQSGVPVKISPMPADFVARRPVPA